jgi:hypothetical protein
MGPNGVFDHPLVGGYYKGGARDKQKQSYRLKGFNRGCWKAAVQIVNDNDEAIYVCGLEQFRELCPERMYVSRQCFSLRIA